MNGTVQQRECEGSDEEPASVSSYAPPSLQDDDGEVSSVLLAPLSEGMKIVRVAFWTVMALICVATIAISIMGFGGDLSIRTFLSLGR